MSFSSELKCEIVKESPKASCCRKSFLSGLLFSKAHFNGETVQFNTENDFFAEYIARLVFEFYGRTLDIQRPPRGGRCRVLSFRSKGAIKYLSTITVNSAYAPHCPLCEANFFKGVFFACGNVANPDNQYLLEFAPVANAEILNSLFMDFSIELKRTTRRGTPVLYLKKSEAIEDFFAKIGLNSAAFAFMNAKIKGEFRNNANRVANCETNNIGKAVSASHRQISVIDELDKANLLSSLPEELEKTARLRIRYRDLSLSQLAAISVPAISKSGLSHRLNKIMELAPHLMPALKK